MMNMFTILIVVMVLWVHTYVKMYQTVHYKYVQFIVYKLYLHLKYQLKKTMRTKETL